MEAGDWEVWLEGISEKATLGFEFLKFNAFQERQEA